MYAKWKSDYTWSDNGDDTVTITGYSDIATKVVVIPDKLGGMTVTVIGAEVFWYKGLTSVIIPEGVLTIGDMAFYGNALTRVEIPGSVMSIGKAAFCNNELIEVAVGTSSNLTSIGISAFSFNKLTAIEIPLSVISIGYAAFYGNRLKELEIPANVATMGDFAFCENNITRVIFGSTPSIGEKSFSNRTEDSIHYLASL